VKFVAARDGTKLAVHEMGTGSPLLCVPGGPGRASAYLENLAGLDEQHTLHLIDTRGTGRSELPADRESLMFPRLADDVADVINDVDLDRPPLLAHSAGCLVAMAFVAANPDSVSHLVLVTPPGRQMSEDMSDLAEIRAARRGEAWHAEAQEAAEMLAAGDVPGGLRRELDRAIRPFAYGQWDERAREHAATTDGQMSLRAWAGFAPDPSYDFGPMLEALGNVRAKVLVVVGARDGLTGAKVGERVAARFATAQRVVIPGAGHYPWVDQPETFRQAVQDFLAD
jgi:proline iminopeptidase